MNEVIYEQYTSDPDFKAYVDSYCKSRQLGIFEALAHITVHEVARYYKEARMDKVESDVIIRSCDNDDKGC